MKAKARLVFRGDRQEIGDIPTFSPTPPSTTNRIAAAVACAEGKTIFHFDVEQAFVQSELDDEVYMRMPPGFGERSGTVVHLRKTLCGLKQAAKEWSGKLGGTLKSLGFEQSLTPCVLESGTTKKLSRTYKGCWNDVDGIVLLKTESFIQSVVR